MRGFQETEGILVRAVRVPVDDARDAGVDQHLRAVDARQVRDVTRGAPGRDAVQGGLDDGVRLRVDRPHAVAVHHEMACLVAVFLSRRRTVEASGQDAFFQHQHSAHEGAVAGAPLGDGVGDLHKVRVPIWAHIDSL